MNRLTRDYSTAMIRKDDKAVCIGQMAQFTAKGTQNTTKERKIDAKKTKKGEKRQKYEKKKDEYNRNCASGKTFAVRWKRFQKKKYGKNL